MSSTGSLPSHYRSDHPSLGQDAGTPRRADPSKLCLRLLHLCSGTGIRLAWDGASRNEGGGEGRMKATGSFAETEKKETGPRVGFPCALGGTSMVDSQQQQANQPAGGRAGGSQNVRGHSQGRWWRGSIQASHCDYEKGCQTPCFRPFASRDPLLEQPTNLQPPICIKRHC